MYSSHNKHASSAWEQKSKQTSPEMVKSRNPPTLSKVTLYYEHNVYGLGYTREPTWVSCPGWLKTVSACIPWLAYGSIPVKSGHSLNSYHKPGTDLCGAAQSCLTHAPPAFWLQDRIHQQTATEQPAGSSSSVPVITPPGYPHLYLSVQ